MADLPDAPLSREEEYLASIAGQNVEVPPCPRSRKEAYLDAINTKMGDIEEDIETLKNNPDVVDIVDTYADLQAYDKTELTDNDIIRVLNDETKDGESTYYRYSTATGQFTYVGTTKQYTDFVGTDGTTAGEAGLVPAPAATDAGKFLKADGTWGEAGGGIIELTMADYNYPTTGTVTTLAPWLLETGVYKASRGMNIRYANIAGGSSYDQTTSDDAIIVVGGEDSNGRRPIYVACGRNSYLAVVDGQLNQAVSFSSSEFTNPLLRLDIIDTLTSGSNRSPLSANQGRVLKNLIDSIAIRGAGAPTTSTVGTVGQLYEDGTNGDLYQLKSIDITVTPNTYNWEEVGGGSGGTQSDYDVNESSDPAYIKNRPFYDLSIELPKALGGGGISSGTPSCFLETETGGNAFPEGSDKWDDAIVQSLMNQGYLIQIDSGAGLTRSFLTAIGLDPNYYERSSLVLLFSDSVDFSVISGGSTILINAGSIDGNNNVTWSWNEQTLTLTGASNHFYANLTGSDRYGSTARFELSIWPQFKVITIRQESGYIGESIRSYSFGGTLNGTLKTIEPKYLPDATSSKKGGVTLSQIGGSIATGAYLRKYESSGLTAIDLRAAPIVDWNSDNTASPQTILNKPFGSIAAGYTYPGSGTQSLYSYSPDWHVQEFEFTSTSDSYADKFGVTQALLNTAGGTLYGTGYCIVTGTGTYATPWNNFLDAVADLADRGGAPSVAFTYRYVDMEEEPPYTGSKTFTGITNNNGIYTAQGEATYYSDYDRYFITNFSFWKETVNNAEVWCYHLSFSISDPWGSVGPEVQGGGAITAVATTTAAMTQQLDASYIPLDPNVFTINAQGQITLLNP